MKRKFFLAALILAPISVQASGIYVSPEVKIGSFRGAGLQLGRPILRALMRCILITLRLLIRAVIMMKPLTPTVLAFNTYLVINHRWDFKRA